MRTDRRIPDQRVLKDEVEAWEADRNGKHAKANWQFTADARVKLSGLYPPHYEQLGRLAFLPVLLWRRWRCRRARNCWRTRTCRWQPR